MATAVFTVLVVASPAYAHVTVNPRSAPKGAFTKLAFRVPNEQDPARTTRVEINFPADHPIAFVSVQPTYGWTYKVDTTDLATPIKSDDGEVTSAVSRITWTADSNDTAVKPGEFQEFNVSAGPLPDTDAIVFKALQTYSNGDIVRWIELPDASGAEPEHPAPTLTLTSDDAATTPTTVASVSDDASAPAATDASDGAARALGIIGIVIGAAGLGFGAFAFTKRRAT